MLKRLRLTDFVVLKGVEVEFGEGLTVITGESGSGKSVFINALGLLLGARAETEVVRPGANEAVLEAVLDSSAELQRRLEALGLPAEGEEVSIRRTVGRQGRVYINGSLTTVSILGRLTRGLLDVAGQNEHIALFDVAEHRNFVDKLAHSSAPGGPLAEYDASWRALKEAERELAALGGDDAQVQAQAEYTAFLLKELEEFAPQAGEEQELTALRRRLQSIEKLRALGCGALEFLDTNEGNALTHVRKSLGSLQEAKRLDESLGPIFDNLAAGQAILDDVARDLTRFVEGLEADPAKLVEVDERLERYRRLKAKHSVAADELPGVLERLQSQLEALTHRTEHRQVASEVLAQQRSEIVKRAEVLRAQRRAAGAALAAAVAERLGNLHLDSARFQVELREVEPGPTGGDEVEFLFSANHDLPLRPLARVASGGEASRLMLAMKSALSEHDGARCSVLDEPDVGLGGAAADAVGRLIKEVASGRQVLCVTHLPQVAAHADVHLLLEREKGGESTVRNLDEAPARHRELARMLSGASVTKEAEVAAAALLKTARRPSRGRRVLKSVDAAVG